MEISEKTLNNLLHQGLPLQVQCLWILIKAQQKDHDGFFHLDQKEWSSKINISKEQLIRYLTSLKKCWLIEKDYRSLGTGNRLFIRPLEPETNECMTFFATLHKCELLDQVEPVIQLHFQDVYNRSGTIRFKQCTALLKGVSIKRCEWLLPGKHICFSASLKVSEQSKEILHVSNLRPSGEYYHA